MAEEYNAFLFVDESWATFIWQNNSSQAYDLSHENVILTGGFAKRFSYPASRVGFICASAEIISCLTLVQDQCYINASRFDQEVILAALQDLPDRYSNELMNNLRNARDNIGNALKQSEIFTQPVSDAGVFWWAPLIEGLASWNAAEKLASQRLIVIPSKIRQDDKDINSFGPSNQEALRISYAMLSQNDITNVANRIADLKL